MKTISLFPFILLSITQAVDLSFCPTVLVDMPTASTEGVISTEEISVERGKIEFDFTFDYGSDEDRDSFFVMTANTDGSQSTKTMLYLEWSGNNFGGGWYGNGYDTAWDAPRKHYWLAMWNADWPQTLDNPGPCVVPNDYMKKGRYACSPMECNTSPENCQCDADGVTCFGITNYLEGSLSFAAGDTHHFELSWDVNGISPDGETMRLAVNGVKLGVDYDTWPFASEFQDFLYLGSPYGGNSNMGGSYTNFKIYNNAQGIDHDSTAPQTQCSLERDLSNLKEVVYILTFEVSDNCKVEHQAIVFTACGKTAEDITSGDAVSLREFCGDNEYGDKVVLTVTASDESGNESFAICEVLIDRKSPRPFCSIKRVENQYELEYGAADDAGTPQVNVVVQVCGQQLDSPPPLVVYPEDYCQSGDDVFSRIILTVEATDESGNSATKVCSKKVKKPKGKRQLLRHGREQEN